MGSQWQRARGPILISVAALLGAGALAAYVWGVLNGEATAVTAATAILVFALGEYFRRRLAAQQYRWDRIAPQYEAFLALIRETVNDKGRNQRKLEEKRDKVMGEFGDKLLLWGSPGVIKAWVAMRRIGSPDVEQQIRAYGQMLLAIRREFGHDDLTLSERDLFRVVFNEEIETLSATGQNGSA